MKAADLVRLALSRLGTGRLRTALTMLGIIIGVASVVALVGVGEGATRGVTDRLQSLGTNLLSINPGFSQGVTRTAGGATTLTLQDAAALRSLSGVQGVAPQLSSSRLVVAGSLNETTTVVGTTPDYELVNAYTTWLGSFLTQPELDGNLRVAVIGATTADNLGLGQSSIGSTISISGLPFQLVGILQPKGGTGFISPDDIVLIPVTTARELFVGTDSVRSIGVSVASQGQIETVKAEVTTALEQRHGIATATGQSDDFTILDQSQLLGTVNSVSGILTVLLAGIASISLLVGGIGIMNIMLVSVRERTREIGIRKAIGARGRDVLAQFLIEALAISVVGGVAGIAIGIVGSFAIGAIAGWGFVFNPATVVVAVAFSLLVGIVFGVWPASQAARLDPVVALRYE
ncbi:MAG TPA: ABC transporter permease [Candidatus Limnocylindrales bacterium]